MDSEKKEINDEACPKPIKTENKKDQNISKINKILSDNTVSEKVFDLLFVIDATGSMSSYIKAAKDETQNISKELRNLYPEYHFQYGYVFYRDPIDSHDDIHEMIDLTDQVNNLPEKIKKIEAYGGGDLPEDWAGGYKLVNEKITWRNGVKVIIHLADAGAHGKEFTLSDKYPAESEKLKTELLKCCQKGIKIFGYVITEDARNSFNQCQNYYRSNGGSYEICEFKIAEEYSDSDSEEYKHRSKYMEKRKCSDDEEYMEIECKKKSKKKCKKKCEKEASDDDDESMDEKCTKKKKYMKEDIDDEEEDYDEDKDCFEDELNDKYDKDVEYKISSKQKKINSEFKTRVLDSVKNSLP